MTTICVHEGRRLREVERNAMQAATQEPKPLKVLARLAGYSMTSYFRTAATRLVRLGLLRRTADGYARVPASQTSRAVLLQIQLEDGSCIKVPMAVVEAAVQTAVADKLPEVTIDASAFAAKVKEAAKNFTPAELAAKVGVSKITARALQAGEQVPQLKTIRKCAEALGVAVG